MRPWTLAAWAFLTLGIAHGLLLGLLRARLGRLVVLGPGRERLAHALARRHRAGAFDRRDGEARRAEGLDDPARDPDLLALAARHLPGALRRADLGAFLRRRSRRAASSSSSSWSSSSAARWRCSPGARRCCSRAACSRRSRARARSSSTTSFSPTACATVFIGTLYPLALEAMTGDKISVGAPFFNLTFVPLDRAAAPAVCRSARRWPGSAATCSARRSGSMRRFGAGARSLTVGVLALRRRRPGRGAARHRARRLPGPRLAERDRRRAPGRRAARSAVALAQGARPAALGLGHGARPCRRRRHGDRHRRDRLERRGARHAARSASALDAGPYEVRLDGVAPRTRGRTTARMSATLTVFRGGTEIGTRRRRRSGSTSTRGMPTTEAGILTRGLSQIYVSLGEVQPDGARRRCGSTASRWSC